MIQILKRLSLIVIIAFAFIGVKAAECVDGIYYQLNQTDKTAKVTYKSWNGGSYKGSIEIPSRITYNDETYTVVSIGEKAFYRCTGLTSVTLPYCVERIESEAFSGCYNLKTFYVSSYIEQVDYDAFYGCKALVDVYIPNIAKWCKTSFYNQESNPLYYATNLYIDGKKVEDLEIYNKKRISDYAFYGCKGISSIYINQVDSIGKNAFYGCSNVKNIKLGSGIKFVDKYAFWDIHADVNITSLEDYCNIDFADYNSNPFYVTSKFYLNNHELWNMVLPNTLTEVKRFLFTNCHTPLNITIPNSVTKIGKEAFYSLSQATSITIPNSVTEIDSLAFDDCVSLTSINIPDGIKSLDFAAFRQCTKLDSVVIPNSVDSIGESVFLYCEGLRKVVLGKSVRSIANRAFGGRYVNSYVRNEDCPDFYCYSDVIPKTASEAFSDFSFENSSLYVPESLLEAYKQTYPWNQFGTIKSLEEIGQAYCATPEITFTNGKLHFECKTENASFHYEIKPIKGNSDSADVDFANTYEVSCYATAENYMQSETSKAIITIDRADVNTDGTVDVSDVNAVISVICNNK